MDPEFLTIMTAEALAKVFRIEVLFRAKALDLLSATVLLAVRSRRACLSSPQQRQDCRRRSHLQQ